MLLGRMPYLKNLWTTLLVVVFMVGAAFLAWIFFFYQMQESGFALINTSSYRVYITCELGDIYRDGHCTMR